MTAVFKRESTAGESYETLFDGAKSLVTGLASVLRVSSHQARVYDSESLHESHTRDSFITAPNAQNLRKYQTERNFGKIKASLLSYLSVKKMKRNADFGESDSQLQVCLFYCIAHGYNSNNGDKLMKMKPTKRRKSNLDRTIPGTPMHVQTRFITIDLFSLGGLLSHFRPCDNTLENSCFQIFK